MSFLADDCGGDFSRPWSCNLTTAKSSRLYDCMDAGGTEMQEQLPRRSRPTKEVSV
jgi:hypothetical protein